MALLVALAASVMWTAAFAPEAQALKFTSAGQLFGAAPDGTPVHQQRIAVEHATGNVLATNATTGQVDVYAPFADGGALLTSFGAGELVDPFGIAVDQRTGAVYVSDAGSNRIVRYTVAAGSPPVYTLDAGFAGPASGGGTGEIGSFAAALAIDGASDRLVVADSGNNLVERFTLSGAYDGLSFDGADSPDGGFTGLLDVAVDSSGDIVVVDATGDIANGDGTSRVLRFDSAGGYEDQIDTSLSRPATVGIRPEDDAVIVSSDQDAVLFDGTPRISMFDAAGDSLGSADMPGDVAYSVVTGVALDDGADGYLYVATDVDRSVYAGAFGLWSVQAFEAVPPAPPQISGESASQLTQSSARVGATVATNGADTTYRFEYGVVGEGFPQSTASASLPDASAAQDVSADVSGLSPNTAYEFRLVADNGVGAPVIGDGDTFTTVAVPPSATLGLPTGVTLEGATLNAAIDMHGVAGSYGFSVVQVGGPSSVIVPRVRMAASSGPVVVSARVDGLLPGKTYTVGVYVNTSAGTTFADPVTFMTTARAVPVEPPRPGDGAGLPYGCLAPRLDPVRGALSAGAAVTLTGADLGVYGTVMFDGVQAAIRSYAADRVTVVVPAATSGRSQVTIDCGRTTNAVTATIGAAPSNRAAITKVVVSRDRATIAVRVPGKGTVAARGRLIVGATARPSRSGTVTLSVRLNRAGRRALADARNRRLSAKVAVRYRPAGGSARTVSRTVVFGGG